MKILLVDNFDSFTFNLAHIIAAIDGTELRVVRNDVVEVEDVLGSSMVVLSPGPGIPKEAGRLFTVIRQCLDQRKKLLGVCLGHQAINEVLGGKLFNLNKVMHGISRKVRIVERSPIYLNVPDEFEAGRYHSWGVDDKFLPAELRVTARGESNEIMSLKHIDLPVSGVQYHPESVLTPEGKKIIENWIRYE